MRERIVSNCQASEVREAAKTNDPCRTDMTAAVRLLIYMGAEAISTQCLGWSKDADELHGWGTSTSAP